MNEISHNNEQWLAAVSDIVTKERPPEEIVPYLGDLMSLKMEQCLDRQGSSIKTLSKEEDNWIGSIKGSVGSEVWLSGGGLGLASAAWVRREVGFGASITAAHNISSLTNIAESLLDMKNPIAKFEELVEKKVTNENNQWWWFNNLNQDNLREALKLSVNRSLTELKLVAKGDNQSLLAMIPKGRKISIEIRGLEWLEGARNKLPKWYEIVKEVAMEQFNNQGVEFEEWDPHKDDNWAGTLRFSWQGKNLGFEARNKISSKTFKARKIKA